jgi:hypothetical protein
VIECDSNSDTGVVTGLLPGIDPAAKNLDVTKALGLILFCPPGSTGLVRSGTVEDEFLVCRERRFGSSKVFQ